MYRLPMLRAKKDREEIDMLRKQLDKAKEDLIQKDKLAKT